MDEQEHHTDQVEHNQANRQRERYNLNYLQASILKDFRLCYVCHLNAITLDPSSIQLMRFNEGRDELNSAI